MTREQRLQRFRVELNVADDGVFLVVSTHSPIMGGATVSLDDLLREPDLGTALRNAPGNGPVEVLSNSAVTDEMLRTLNHRRDQLRVGRVIVLVFDPFDCARVSRVADDLWKWATVVELDRAEQSWERTQARGVVDCERYAPALQPDDVVGPQGSLTARVEEPKS